jgi:hypothetical protein
MSMRYIMETTHLHIVPKSRMRGVIPPLPNTPSWHSDQLKNRDNFTFINKKSGRTRRKKWWPII